METNLANFNALGLNEALILPKDGIPRGRIPTSGLLEGSSTYIKHMKKIIQAPELQRVGGKLQMPACMRADTSLRKVIYSFKEWK